jgi:ABC-type phosphate transport system substrate-binding protein
MKLKTIIGSLAAGAVLGTTLLSGVAGADGTNPGTSGTGWDDIADVIVGGGSDTTYAWHSLAEKIYNQADGCRVVTSSTSADKGNCLEPIEGQDNTNYTGNWDHDAAVSAYPVGSSSGVKELTSSPAVPGGKWDYARSSRGPKSSGETGTVFWGVAKESIAVVTFTGRAVANLTSQEVRDIYQCVKTDWSQVGGGAYGSGPIIPVGMNPDSGTYASFQSFLGFAPNNGACVKGLDGNKTIYPFENDIKQLNNNAWLNSNKANEVFWMSSAAWRAYPFKRQDAGLNTLDGKSAVNAAQVATGSYPITRIVNHVTRATDASPVVGTDEVSGGTTGKSGAVREFTEFLCKDTSRHGINEFTGNTNAVELSKATTATGYFTVPTNQRTNGVCAVQFAP